MLVLQKGKAIDLGVAKNLNLNEWKAEIKIDGSREVWTGRDLISSRGVNHNERYFHIYQALKGLDAVLDGEVALSLNSNVLELNKKENWKDAKFYVFDVLRVGDRDTTKLTYLERKALLGEVLEPIRERFDFVYIVEPFQFEDFSKIWERVKENGCEGLVFKKADSVYSGGAGFIDGTIEFIRTGTWLKLKARKDAVLKIIGHEEGSQKGAFILEGMNRVSALTSELVSLWKNKGNEEWKAEIEYLFKTEDGKLFQPVLKRILNEKDEIVWGD